MRGTHALAAFVARRKDLWMSEASVAHSTAPHRLWRALLLVAGVFAILLLAPKPARADGILGPVTDAVDQVASVSDETVEQVSTTVDDVASTVPAVLDVDQTVAATVGSVTQVATDAIETVNGTLDPVATTLDQVVTTVDQTVATTVGTVGAIVSTAADTVSDAAQPVLDQTGVPGAPSHPTGGDDDPVPNMPSPPVPPAPVPTPTPAHHHVPASGAVAGMLMSGTPDPAAMAGDSRADSSNAHKLPAAPQHGTAGAATPAGDGSPGPGGHGPTQLAAILVATLVLASASSRWLRLFAFARAPNPFIPILVSPG